MTRPPSSSPSSSTGTAIVFAVLALAMMYADTGKDLLMPVRRPVGVALYPIQHALNWPGNQIRAVRNQFDDIDRLREENRMLRQILTQQAGVMARTERLQQENTRLRELVELKPRIERPGIVAEAQSRPRTQGGQKIQQLDKGSQHGVARGQPVVDAFGVIGQITRVYAFHSEMTLITDPGLSVPVTNRRTGQNTIISGASASGDAMTLPYQSANADIRTGDVLLTSGLDTHYPPGIPVGSIDRIDQPAGDPFTVISVKPSGQVQRPHMVLILRTDQFDSPDDPQTDEPRTEAAPAPEPSSEAVTQPGAGTTIAAPAQAASTAPPAPQLASPIRPATNPQPHPQP